MIAREKFRTTLRLLLLVVLCALPARAATWVLANGDRLTGTLVRETETEVEIRHEQLGTLKLPRTALAPVVSAPTAAALAKVPTAPDTPPAGPDSTVPAARRAASSSGAMPPCDSTMKRLPLKPASASRFSRLVR